MVLVDIESTYPAVGGALLQRAQPYFPTLPIILLSPRVSGFSRSYATFDLDHLVVDLNADTLNWQDHLPPMQNDEVPF